MIVRAHLDISWSDLAYGARSCIAPSSGDGLEARILGTLPQGDQGVVSLSVRSGFDLLLEAAGFPGGSEVLLTAITVPDMAKIVRAHGLVPVPVDVDPQTLEPDPQALRAALSPRSKMLVAAHLFGGVVELGPARAFAKAHGLLFVEDCAQSFIPGAFHGHPDSDVRMLSFGPIKTNTAMGGAVLLVADAGLRRGMVAAQAAWPVQPRRQYLRRMAKYAGLQLLGHRPVFAAFRAVCRARGKDFDAVLRQLARGFPGSDLLGRLRQRPTAANLDLLARRLEGSNLRVPRRQEAGHRLAEALGPEVERAGARVRPHTHWLFPVLCDDPDGLRAHLGAAGFDATHGASSLTVVAAADERPDVVPVQARELMRRILFVPAYPEMGEAALRRLGQALSAWAAARPPAPPAVRPVRAGTA